MTSRPTELSQIIAQEKPRRRKMVFIIVLILIALLLFARFGSHEQKQPTFTTATVERGDLITTVTATGTLAPLNQVDVGSEVSGVIESISVDFNDRVKRGQVLARINTDEQQARVVQSRAALEVAEARVLQASVTVRESQHKLARCETLSQQGYCPSQELETLQANRDRAVADEASAKAQVSQAKATLNADQTRLAKAVIRSPIDGVVLKRAIEPGQTVAASLQAPILFTLAENLSQMALHVSVDEADIGQVHVGQKATFSVDAYNEQGFAATLTQVRMAPQNSGGVVSYETILAVDNQALTLRPGMTATARIVVQEIKGARLLPNAALRFTPPVVSTTEDQNLMDKLLPRWGNRNSSRDKNEQQSRQKQVWILKEQRPMAITLQTGASDGRTTEIIEGDLQPGSEVLTGMTGGPAQ